MAAFTLLEVLISIGLSAALAAFSMLIGLGAYQQARTQSSESAYSFASAFAELQSLQGICRHEECVAAEAHGLRASAGALELFEGTSYESKWLSTMYVLPIPSSLTASTSITTIYFPDGSVSSSTP